jgi:site-specific recombinase XerD
VTDDLAAKIPTVRQRETPTRASDDANREQLVEACTSLRDVALIELIHATGLRISEASALKVTDVDIESGAVRVSKSKNGSVRVAGLFSPSAVTAMQKWLIVRATMADADEGPLWLTRSGQPMSHGGVVSAMRSAADRAGVSGLRTTLAAAGQSMRSGAAGT